MAQNERPVVEISIAGKPYHFLIDTGGVTSEIDSDIVQQLGLELENIDGAEIYDVAGNVAKRYARVNDIQIGRLHASRFNMVVRDRNSDDATIDGILGPDFLSLYDLDLDFANRKVSLFLSDHCPGKAVYWTTDYAVVDFHKQDGHIILPMTLDGHDIYATLDSGSNDTMIAQHIARQTYDIDDNTPGVEKEDHPGNGDFIVSRYRFKSLSAGGLTVNKPLIYILPDLAEESFRRKHTDSVDVDPIDGPQLDAASLLLGMNVLSKLHVYISYKEDKVYLSAVDAH
jgi:predicted aspartyl protease